MGESGNSYNTGSIEITFSTRSLLRWAELTIRYQPLANQGIQPVAYSAQQPEQALERSPAPCSAFWLEAQPATP